MVKFKSLIFVVLAVLLAITGCSKKSNQKAENKQGNGEKITLKVWVMPNSSKPKEDMLDVISNFTEEHPNINVNVEVLDWGSAWTKISTATTSGDAPDIVQLGTTWCSQFSAMGAFLDIDSLAKAVGGDSAFVKGMWTYAKPIMSKHVTSLPWIADVRPMFYRRDVYQKAGIDPVSVKDWKGFSESLEKIKKANLKIEDQKVAPIGFPGKNDWNVVHNLAPWIWGAGGDFISEDGQKSLLDKKETLDGIMYYISMVKDGYMPKDYLEKNTAQLSVEFDQGRLANWFEPTSKYVYLNKPAAQGGAANTIGAKNYGVLLPPAGPKGLKVFLGGSNLAIFKVTKHPKEAQELLKYLTTDKEAQIAYFRISGMLPAYKAAFDDPYFSNDDIRKVFKEMTKYGKAYPSVPYWAEIETSVLTPVLGNIFEYVKLKSNKEIKREDVAKFLSDASAQIDNIIKKFNEKHEAK